MTEGSTVLIAEKYQVLRRVGSGGMGAVFEARHTLTGRRLAVKVLHSNFARNDELVARFLREARAAASIGDPHVVEVVDLGRTADGDVYMVLEFLEGRELRDAIKQECPFPAGRAAHVARQIAAVMGKAHALGVIHRDLKPANLFLIPRDGDPDYVKVLDFGIAKLLGVDADGGAPDPQLTKTGQIIGTPLYMSPEQLQGSREVTAATDVYAVGVILYQMLTGEVPYPGETVPDIYLKVMTTTAPGVRERRSDLTPEFSAVIEKAMVKDVSARYPDGLALAEALAPFAGQWVPGSAKTAEGQLAMGGNAAALRSHPMAASGHGFDAAVGEVERSKARRRVGESAGGRTKIAVGVGALAVVALGLAVASTRPVPPAARVTPPLPTANVVLAEPARPPPPTAVAPIVAAPVAPVAPDAGAARRPERPRRPAVTRPTTAAPSGPRIEMQQ